MKYKVGDIVRTTKDRDADGVRVFPVGTIGKITKISDIQPIRVETEDNYYYYSEDMLEPFKTYEQGWNDGRNETWEFVRIIYDMKCDEIEKIFGVSGGLWEVIRDYSPQEALAKLKAYEEEQNKIEVGDVVENIVRDEVFVGVVSNVDCDVATVMWIDGTSGLLKRNGLKKTGKHIDIKSILEQIGE